MVRVNGSHWTADFTLSRAINEAFVASEKSHVLYFCVGEPQHPADRFGPDVGTELLAYYPHVLGTRDEPITAGNVVQKWREARADKSAFIVAITATGGSDQSLGFIEVSDRGIPRPPKMQQFPGLTWIGDCGIVAYVWEGDMPSALSPAQFNRLQRLSGAVVDGQIRFLQRAKLYLPPL